MSTEPFHRTLDAVQINPTAWRFEGADAGAGISWFMVRTRPGRSIEMHTHPYPETFVLLEGRARWTIGDAVTELDAESVIVAPAETPHGLRNVGDVPLLVFSVHESPRVEQTFLGIEPR